jgi:hypothetical protein
MDEPDEYILSDFGGFDGIGSHVKSKSEYGRMMGSVEVSKRIAIASLESLHQVTIDIHVRQYRRGKGFEFQNIWSQNICNPGSRH